MPLTILFNGQPRVLDTAAQPSLAQFVADLGLRPDRVAIEHNGRVISRKDWPGTLLADADRVELVQFVGGGNAPVSSRSSRSHRSP